MILRMILVLVSLQASTAGVIFAATWLVVSWMAISKALDEVVSTRMLVNYLETTRS